MAIANQLKELLKSYIDGDDERFYSIAMQFAAHEARIGHGKLAKELRDLVAAVLKSRLGEKTVKEVSWKGLAGKANSLSSAELATKLGAKAEAARELCYRLYTLCERKKRAAEALSYNGLVQSWPEIMRLAQAANAAEPQTTQALLFSEE